MSSEIKKRSRPIPLTSQRSTKRQKIDRAPSKYTTDVKKLPVALDALPWSEVEMPDMFEDAEGFFGLEEVDDVEVIRDGGKIQFLSKEAQEDNLEDNFEGFSNEDNVVSIRNAHQTIPSETTMHTKVKKDHNKLSKKESQNRNQVSKRTSNKYRGNTFTALENSAVVEEIDLSAWQELNLASQTLSAIAKLGFLEPTPIQRSAIPEILGGHDVIGKASTGSGKTLAFTIPVLERWLSDHLNTDSDTRIPTALILSPTRELAHQIANHIKALCSGLPDSPYVATVTGGLSIQKQLRQFNKADIIIGTPGRLWEIISSSVEVSKAMNQIKFLIIDEADRLLTEGHFKEAEEILNSLDRKGEGGDDDDENFVPARQTLVFSATFHKGLQQKLAGKGKQGLLGNKSMEYLLDKLNFREEKPKFVDVNPTSQMAEGLKEGMVECAGTEKDLYLYALLLHHPKQRTLIFTNSIHSVRRLVPLLQNLSLSALPLHSQMLQKARLRSIERFSAHSPITSSILVATDVAARGLDISSINLIIHYHLPRSADTYVHRSGRTARAHALGTSILLCAPEEVVPMRRLVAKVHAQSAISTTSSKARYLRSIDLDRKVVARLKTRVVLAKRIADAALAKEKKGHDDDWVRSAAEELGVDYDSEEFDAAGGGKNGRGTGRKQKEKDARALSKGDVRQLQAELKGLLSQRVNIGVSETYLTSGRLDVNALLKGKGGDFLGTVGGIGLED